MIEIGNWNNERQQQQQQQQHNPFTAVLCLFDQPPPPAVQHANGESQLANSKSCLQNGWLGLFTARRHDYCLIIQYFLIYLCEWRSGPATITSRYQPAWIIMQ